MDLSLYLRVLWRFRVIVGLGLLLALSLTFLSVVRVSFDHGKPQFTYRLSQTWSSTETLLITAKGTPWARINDQSVTPGGLATLSAFYAALANSDKVQERLRESGRVPGVMFAQPVVDRVTQNRGPLPFVSIIGTAKRGVDAVSTASRGGNALIDYVVSTQNSANIPKSQRIQITVLTEAQPAKLLAGRKKTLPIVIFVTIMIATIGLAFILENLRPRVQLVDSSQMTSDADRQTA